MPLLTLVKQRSQRRISNDQGHGLDKYGSKNPVSRTGKTVWLLAKGNNFADMTWFYFILVLVGTFIAMEGITWATHKWVMHGFLWYLHRDHHQVEPGFFEKNDAFFFIFAIPSFLLIMFGSLNQVWWQQAIGFGIMAYGIAYFLVHDVIIHQRFKWFSRSKSTYVRAIRWAHKMHHKHLDKHEGESFGMLYVHKKYWEKVRRDKQLMAGKKVAYAPEQ
jgi:beta-carotene 3-hydroxylase